MSALHWEARRKQAVIDHKIELRRKMFEKTKTADKNGTYDDKIREVADRMSADLATPTSTLLHRSHALLVQMNNDRRDQENAENFYYRKVEQKTPYSAKLKNRYTSINYIQQY
ncbi:uncharacterized protein LOC143464719 [Clavelina lepadiformis]|uniref:uncharacterized protein LOC143464719 n=1 Tax=Clavelina lepadiformis TaxID=159417 RepID=UPI004042FB3F